MCARCAAGRNPRRLETRHRRGPWALPPRELGPRALPGNPSGSAGAARATCRAIPSSPPCRPDPSLVHLQPAGVMLSIAPDAVVEVVISRGQRRWRFERAKPNGWGATPGQPLDESLGTRLDTGLRFLHVSAPQRVLQPDEVAGISPSEFGLAPPRYSVSVRATGAPPFEIEF